MRLHGRHRDPLGELEIARRELAHEDARALDQVDDLVELAHRVVASAGGVDPGLDGRPPLAGVDDHAVGAQVVEIRRRRPDRHGLAAGTRAAALARGRHAGHLRGEHLAVELRDEPADGPREPAAGPAHGARELEARDGRRDRRRHELGSRRRSPVGHDPHEAVALLERRGVRPVLAREALPRLLGGVGARAAHLAPLSLAALRKAVCHDREPPGGDMDADALRGQAGPVELGGEEPGERRLRDAAVRGRELLAPDLDEQIRHRKRSPPSRDARPRRPASGAASAGCRPPGR